MIFFHWIYIDNGYIPISPIFYDATVSNIGTQKQNVECNNSTQIAERKIRYMITDRGIENDGNGKPEIKLNARVRRKIVSKSRTQKSRKSEKQERRTQMHRAKAE